MPASFNPAFLVLTRLDKDGKPTNQQFISAAQISTKPYSLTEGNDSASRGATTIIREEKETGGYGEVTMKVTLANLPATAVDWLADNLGTWSEAKHFGDGAADHEVENHDFAIEAWTPVAAAVSPAIGTDQAYAYQAFGRFTPGELELVRWQQKTLWTQHGVARQSPGMDLFGRAHFREGVLIVKTITSEAPFQGEQAEKFAQAITEYQLAAASLASQAEDQGNLAGRVQHNSGLVFHEVALSMAEKVAKDRQDPLPEEPESDAADPEDAEEDDGTAWLEHREKEKQWDERNRQEVSKGMEYFMHGLRVLANDRAMEHLSLEEFIMAYDQKLI